MDIKDIAHHIYLNRIKANSEGNDKSDWQMAEKIAKSPARKALFIIHCFLLRLEKKVWEPVLVWTEKQSLLKILGLVSNVGIIIAVVTYIGTERQRRDAEILNAWQTITSAHGQSGSGGRIQALEFLNTSPDAHWRRRFPWLCAPHPICLWPAESLDGLNLGIDSPSNLEAYNLNNSIKSGSVGVYLEGISLPGANLNFSNLESAILWNANLEKVNLYGANLRYARLDDATLENASLGESDFRRASLWNTNIEHGGLWRVNFEEANLENANLSNALLSEANFKRAHLSNTNLEKSNLSGANFEDAVLAYTLLKGANLRGANLEKAILWEANLEGSRLEEVDLKDAIFYKVDLRDVEGLTQEKLTQAKLCDVSLPESLTLDSNRDCYAVYEYQKQRNQIELEALLGL